MLRIAVLGVATVAFAAVLAGGAGADEPKPEAGMAGKVTASAGFDKQHGPHSQVECTVTSGGANTNLDCDDPFPNNEPDIEVDSIDAGHMIASSNDYGTCCDQFYTTFDGGATWTTGNMSRNNPQQTGSDPVTAIDRKHGVAIHSSLNYSFQLPTGETCRGDLTSRRRMTEASRGIPPSSLTPGSDATRRTRSCSTTRSGSSPITLRRRPTTDGRT